MKDCKIALYGNAGEKPSAIVVQKQTIKPRQNTGNFDLRTYVKNMELESGELNRKYTIRGFFLESSVLIFEELNLR